jgi:hypothetical protein
MRTVETHLRVASHFRSRDPKRLLALSTTTITCFIAGLQAGVKAINRST